MFFWRYHQLRPARLADVSADLVNLHVVIRDDVEGLMRELAPHQAAFVEAVAQGNAALQEARRRRATDVEAIAARNAPYDALFTAVRQRFNHEKGLPPITRAALMRVLAATCINGLWRENRKGHFNGAPGKQYGKDKGGPIRCPTILDEPNLRAVSAALQGADLAVRDVVESLDAAEREDFYFVDTPYVPVTDTANFVGYTAGGFKYEDHARVAQAVRRAHRRGARIAVANSDVPEARALYQGFNITTVQARRSINRDGDGRGPVPEILVRTWV